MDFFTRRKPCLFIENKTSLENTKQIFSNKLLFLQRQYKLCFEALHKHPQIAPEFLQSSLFQFDLNSKIIAALHRLTNSSEVEWILLKSFCEKDIFTYLLGALSENTWLVKVDKLCQNSDLFFFKLLQLGIIDSDTWLHLSRLKSAADTVGISNLNDFAYYQVKDLEIIESSDSIKDFSSYLKEIKQNFYASIGKNIEFKRFDVVFWKFFKELDKHKNHQEIVSVFFANKHRYSSFRESILGKKLPIREQTYLTDGVSKVDNFKHLQQVLCEFKLVSNESTRKLFSHVFLCFLTQEGHVFDPMNPKYVKRNLYEQFLDATQFLDIFNFLSLNSIELGTLDATMQDNLAKACEIELSILKDKRVIRHMYILNNPNFVLLMDIVRSLRGSNFYKSKYSIYLDSYLNLVKDF